MPTSRNARSRPLLLRGSLIVLKRKCGKSSCHCAAGEPHESPALSVSVAGVTKMLTLRAKDVPTVRAALTRYRSAVDALDQQAVAGIATLRERLEREKAAERRRRR